MKLLPVLLLGKLPDGQNYFLHIVSVNSVFISFFIFSLTQHASAFIHILTLVQ